MVLYKSRINNLIFDDSISIKLFDGTYVLPMKVKKYNEKLINKEQ
jgi:hypothetical protein